MNTTVGNTTNSTLSPTWDGGYQNFLLPGIPILVSSYMNLFLGLPTNGYVLWLIVKGMGGTIQSEFFALNLTLSEIVYCVSNIMYIMWTHQNILDMVLQIISFFSTFMHSSRPLFQTCICLERYLAVVHPVVFLRYKALRYRLACCSVVWLLITSISFFAAFADLTAVSFYLIGGYLVVLSLVQLFCCLSVLRVLRQSGPGEGGREGGVSSNIKRRAFKIILLILITMLMSYLPLIITVVLLICGYLALYDGTLYFAFYISTSIAIICGLVQPLLFLHRTGKLPCLNMAP